MNDTDKINGGYVVFARAALDSQLWQCGPDVLRLSMYLLLQARFNPIPKKYPGFVVSRGDVLTSLSTISEDCSWFENRMVRKWSRGKVSRMLAVLSKIGFCRTISDTYGTHLNICKYEIYQDLNKYKSGSDGTTPNSDGHETERPRTLAGHNSKKVQEGCKNDKKEKHTHFRALDFLVNAGAKKQLAADWLKSRKEKRLANSETAFLSFLKEVEKSGKTINDVLEYCCIKSWGGFKATWPWEESHPTQQKQEEKKCAGCGILREFGPCNGKTESSPACARYEVRV